MTDEELMNLIRSAYARTAPKKRIGLTPVDINELLKGDDEAYFPQLHYSRQYDVRGYPQMRREFVDYLETKLDQPRTAQHVESIRIYQMTPLIRALRYLEERFPESWGVYVACVLQGYSVLEVAESTAVRSARVLKILDHSRRVVEAAYQLAARKKE